MSDRTVSIRVWGDFACFTRPEMKVERVSYPVMTPSAARGILEAIFWEPEIYYLVDSVRVVKKGRWVSIRRNEVTKVVSLQNAAQWLSGSVEFSPILAGGGAQDGTQRNMLALEDVEYVITAQMALSGLGRQSDLKLKKYFAELRRRAQLGKCFQRPALGMREFACDFEWEDDPDAALARRSDELYPGRDWRSTWPAEKLGLMLYDVFNHDLRAHGFRWVGDAGVHLAVSPARTGAAARVKGGEKIRGKGGPPRYVGEKLSPQAYFFHAEINDATLDCNPERVRLVGKPPREG